MWNKIKKLFNAPLFASRVLMVKVVIGLLIIVALASLGFFLILKNKYESQNQPFIQDTNTEREVSLPRLEGYKINDVTSVYKVKLINEENIILDTNGIDLILPFDAKKVKVYSGLAEESSNLPLSELKVGDRVILRSMPDFTSKIFLYKE